MLGLKVVKKSEWDKSQANIAGLVTAHEDLEYKVKQVTQYYAQRVRIGHKPFNVFNVTATLRGQVDPSLVVDYDGNQIIVSGDAPLSEAQYNHVVSILGFELNRT